MREACYDRRMNRALIRAALLLLALLARAEASSAQRWKILTGETDSDLRGISAAKTDSGGHVAIWASGSHGVVLRSTDDGVNWSRLTVSGGGDLDFRGVVAFNEKIAYLMASGEGEKSRIYKTVDGGANWELQFKGAENSLFLDSIACLSETKCFALGDPIDGKFVILKTTDGRRWNQLPAANLPAALDKEGAFAASNSNLLLVSEDEFYFVTGGFAARVLHTFDGEHTWLAYSVPIAADNSSSGVFSIASGSNGRPVVVGGDYANPIQALRVAAVFNPTPISEDAGIAWQSPKQQPNGYRSAVAALIANEFLAVGPTGSDISTDNAAHWTPFPSPPLNAVFALDAKHVYAAGPKGLIAQFVPANPK